jgi:RND family efflux transporter MFP subunit|tara:strand:- start:36498 stop:37658 length:1161 start_codon:yes stop_codon:yes gene_type:complete
MKKIKLNIILAILLSIFLVFRISTKESTPDFRFSTTEVVTGDIIESVMSSGKIIPGEEIKVYSRVNGDIYKTYVEYGDIVKKGQILIELDSSTYENELSTKLKNLEILNIELTQMKKKVDTDIKLLEGGYIAKIELEESENDYRIKSIEIDELQTSIDLLNQQISDTKLTSPIDGRVDYLNEDLITEGKMFVNSWAYTISSGHRDLNISLSIDGREITKVDVGQNVEFSVENSDKIKFLGVVKKIVEPIGLKPNIDKSPVFYEVIVKILDTNSSLKTGLSVDATINIQVKNNINKIKRSCLRFVPPEGILIKKAPNNTQGSDVIWTLNNDNSLSAYSVITGIKDSEYVEIIDRKNLPKDSKIITSVEIVNKNKSSNGFSLPQPKRY